MLPFYHPTSVMLIDDDASFLQSLGRFLDSELLWHSFLNPREAVEFAFGAIGSYQDMLSSAGVHRLRHWDADGGHLAYENRNTSLSEICKLKQRYSVPSVAIIDYDMPALSGVDVCRQLGELPIKKILLTGKVGADTAIDAFNQGLIDRFHLKRDLASIHRLTEDVLSLQREFFGELAPMPEIFQNPDTAFAASPDFDDFFSSVCDKYQIVEHYISMKPPGLSCLTRNGEVIYIVVVGPAWIAAQAEVAAEQGAERELVELLSTGSVFAYFPTDSGFYEPQRTDSWRKYIWPLQAIDGPAELSCTVVRQNDCLSWLPEKFVSFKEFEEGNKDLMHHV